MDREAWLRERRQTAEERHDAIHAFTYDERYGEIGPTHRRFVADLLERCPPGGTVTRTSSGDDAEYAASAALASATAPDEVRGCSGDAAPLTGATPARNSFDRLQRCSAASAGIQRLRIG